WPPSSATGRWSCGTGAPTPSPGRLMRKRRLVRRGDAGVALHGRRPIEGRRKRRPYMVVFAVARKDLRSEVRGRELLPALAEFLGSPISPAVVLTVLLATIGMAALGCLFAALAAQTRARELLLPVLALPLWIPFVVVGGRAVQQAMGGQALAGQPLAV